MLNTSFRIVRRRYIYCLQCRSFLLLYISGILFFTEIPCDKIGYTWNSELALCYKLHSDRKTGTDAKAQCTTDHPGSRLLLIDSDAIFTFHLKIIGTIYFYVHTYMYILSRMIESIFLSLISLCSIGNPFFSIQNQLPTLVHRYDLLKQR